MSETIEIAKNIGLREAGKSEYWLQEQIFDNPNCLGLGELESIERERRQSSGGRLDILLKDPEDDTMYEVEIMLGETDETHIIRTIEYWDNEKRRWPQRQHFAVLVAEKINRLFFNVIHLLSNAIPIIAIQVSLNEAHGKCSLCFTKIIDTFEEVDDGTSETIKYTRDDWVKKSKWTLETADYLVELFSSIFNEPILNYLKGYIAITSQGNFFNYLWLQKKSQNKSSIGFRLKNELHEKLIELLDQNNISYNNRRKKFYIIIDKKTVEKNKEVFIKIAEIINESKNGANVV